MRTFTTIFLQDLAQTEYKCEPEVTFMDEETNEVQGICTLIHNSGTVDVAFEIAFKWKATLNVITEVFENIAYDDDLEYSTLNFNDDEVMIYDTKEERFITEFHIKHIEILNETIESTNWIEEITNFAQSNI